MVLIKKWRELPEGAQVLRLSFPQESSEGAVKRWADNLKSMESISEQKMRTIKSKVNLK